MHLIQRRRLWCRPELLWDGIHRITVLSGQCSVQVQRFGRHLAPILLLHLQSVWMPHRLHCLSMERVGCMHKQLHLWPADPHTHHPCWLHHQANAARVTHMQVEPRCDMRAFCLFACSHSMLHCVDSVRDGRAPAGRVRRCQLCLDACRPQPHVLVPIRPIPKHCVCELRHTNRIMRDRIPEVVV